LPRRAAHESFFLLGYHVGQPTTYALVLKISIEAVSKTLISRRIADEARKEWNRLIEK
jgi:hypothetical protein